MDMDPGTFRKVIEWSCNLPNNSDSDDDHDNSKEVEQQETKTNESMMMVHEKPKEADPDYPPPPTPIDYTTVGNSHYNNEHEEEASEFGGIGQNNMTSSYSRYVYPEPLLPTPRFGLLNNNYHDQVGYFDDGDGFFNKNNWTNHSSNNNSNIFNNTKYLNNFSGPARLHPSISASAWPPLSSVVVGRNIQPTYAPTQNYAAPGVGYDEPPIIPGSMIPFTDEEEAQVVQVKGETSTSIVRDIQDMDMDPLGCFGPGSFVGDQGNDVNYYVSIGMMIPSSPSSPSSSSHDLQEFSNWAEQIYSDVDNEENEDHHNNNYNNQVKVHDEFKEAAFPGGFSQDHSYCSTPEVRRRIRERRQKFVEQFWGNTLDFINASRPNVTIHHFPDLSIPFCQEEEILVPIHEEPPYQGFVYQNLPVTAPAAVVRNPNTEFAIPLQIPSRHMPCHICGRPDIKYNCERVTHGASHTVTMLCEICGIKARSKVCLWEHFNTTHFNVAPLICQICEFRTGSRRALLNHKELEHKD